MRCAEKDWFDTVLLIGCPVNLTAHLFVQELKQDLLTILLMSSEQQ